MAKRNNKETYIVVRKKPWKDLQDNDYIYNQGDIFPREGLEVSKKRLEELSTINNKIGEVLIQKVEIEENKKEKEADDTNSDEVTTDKENNEDKDKNENENDNEITTDTESEDENKVEDEE